MKKVQGNDILWFLLLLMFYGVCGMIGSIFSGFYILSGFLSIPLGLYILKKGFNYYVLMEVILLIAIIAILFDGVSVLVFTILLIIPGIVFGTCERRQTHLLTTVLISGMTYFIGVLLIFGILMGVYQVSIPKAYNEVVEEVQNQTMIMLDQQEPMIIQQFEEEEEKKTMEESYRILRIAMKEGFYYMQYLFPGLLFLLCFGFGFFQCLLSHLIITGMGWRESQLKKLVNFGITPVIPIALVITWFWRQSLDEQIQSLLAMAFSNVLFVFSILLFILGILSILYMVRTMKTGIGLKIFFTAMSVIGIFTTPVLFVILGFFDGIFNFRKAERFI